MMRVGVVPDGCPVNPGILHKRIHRHAVAASAALQVAMRIDESSRVVIVARVLCEPGPAHTNLDVLSNFQMQMGIVQPVSGTDRGDLLTAANDLSSMHQDSFAVPVQRINVSDHTILTITVPDNDHVPPAHVTITSEHHNPIADAVNRIA